MTALMERVHSDVASPSGRKCFFLMVLGSQGIAQIYEVILELLTLIIGQNTI